MRSAGLGVREDIAGVEEIPRSGVYTAKITVKTSATMAIMALIPCIMGSRRTSVNVIRPE